ncbi:MAG: ATP-binding protein [Clostridia bacterium]|nr:ATP-binding protein [Clostridia bacterium]
MDENLKASIPVGIEDYTELVTKFHFIDKTLLIKEMVDNPTKVYLLTRPRRFGKTLNLSMLKTFYEKTTEDTSVYFKDMKIWQCGDKYTSRQGKYPVIFFTFKNVKADTWATSYSKFKSMIAGEYARHAELLGSDKLNSVDADRLERIMNLTADRGEYELSLLYLSEMLRKHHGVCPIILIDEYDAPVQYGYENGYYDDVISFISGLFTAGLKTNFNLEFAVLTGVLRISKASLFSDLNNIQVYSTQDQLFSEYFGFTREEVKDLLAYYGGDDKFEEVCRWYDGYMFGQTEIFNPWSVLKYIQEGFVPKEYWLKTSRNSLLGQLLKNLSPDVDAKFSLLLKGEAVTASINEELTYPELRGDCENVFTLLLFSGYLKSLGKNTDYISMYKVFDEDDDSEDNSVEDGCRIFGENDEEGEYHYLAIPNREVRKAFKSEIVSKVRVNGYEFNKVWSSIETFDENKMEEGLHEFVEELLRNRNSPYEFYYEGLLACLCKYKSKDYYINPEQESGAGRVDISLEPRHKGDPGIIFELKSIKRSDTKLDPTDESQHGEILNMLKGEADVAVRQIIRKKYDTVLTRRGINDVVKIGLAFMGDLVRVSVAR